MKTPFTLIFCLYCISNSFASYLIHGVHTDLPIQRVGKMILIPGEVDGVQGYLLLDTGAPELILNKRFFPNRELGNTGNIQDISDSVECWKLRVRHFRMGDIFRHNFEAVVADFQSTELAVGQEILGLLGYDVLKHFELRLDYYADRITFCALDKDGNPPANWQPELPDHSLAFGLEGHLPTIQGQLMSQKKIIFGLDSGSSINLMDADYQPFLRKNCLKERTISFQGINVLIKDAPHFVMPKMELANAYHINFWRTSITNFSHFDVNGIQIDGILGANFFQLGKMTINYKQRKIEIWETPGRINRRYVCQEHGGEN